MALAGVGLSAVPGGTDLHLAAPPAPSMSTSHGGAHPAASAAPAAPQVLTAAPDLTAAGPSTRVARDTVIVQLPERVEQPDPDLHVQMALPAILSAAPRGQVLEQTVVEPALQQSLALRVVFPILQAAAPFAGVATDELATVLANAGLPVTPGPTELVDPESPLIAMAPPADTRVLLEGDLAPSATPSAPAGTPTPAASPSPTSSVRPRPSASATVGAPKAATPSPARPASPGTSDSPSPSPTPTPEPSDTPTGDTPSASPTPGPSPSSSPSPQVGPDAPQVIAPESETGSAVSPSGTP